MQTDHRPQVFLLWIIYIKSLCISKSYDLLWGLAGLKMPIHNNFFRRSILSHAVGQTDLDFGVWSGFIGVQDDKSLCAAVTICYTVVNIQTQVHTHREHFDQLVWKAWPDELKALQVTLIYNWQCGSEAVTFLVTPTVSPSGAIVQCCIFCLYCTLVCCRLVANNSGFVCVFSGGGRGRWGRAPWAALCREGRKYGILNLAASGELAFALRTVIFLHPPVTPDIVTLSQFWDHIPDCQCSTTHTK